MRFNSHSSIAGKHAFLSPSAYHWINYDEHKLKLRYRTATLAARGTDLHELAHQAIRLGIKLHTVNKTIAMYVNDAIGYKMTSEQPLFYSENCFGTADTISFRRRKLRIHDLKTGISRTSEKQLYVYAALFCLEYEMSPFDIEIELRIYQNEEARVYIPDPEHVQHIMDKIVESDHHIEMLKESELNGDV